MTNPADTTTQRYIAFLRAINVGGHTVKMDRLRSLFTALGFRNVTTFIASGNVIFDARTSDAELLEKRIERHLKQALGYDVATFLRTPAELKAIAAHEAFPAVEIAQGYALYVAFTSKRPTLLAKRQLMNFRSEVNDFHVHKREIYYLCRVRVSESAFSGSMLEKAIGMSATMRNVTTVNKLAAIYG